VPAVLSALGPKTAVVPKMLVEPKTRVEPKSGLTFIHIPAGSFHYGCEPQDTQCDSEEKPGRTVNVGAFWLGKTDVTAGAYLLGATTPRTETYSYDRLLRLTGMPLCTSRSAMAEAAALL
jgi:formylglycine-generating enzyme required for sulfatase activity